MMDERVLISEEKMQTLKQWFLAGYAYGLPTMRRPMMGPISFGLLFGGIPLALIFSGLAGRVISPELLRYLVLATPVSVLVTTVATALGAGSVSKRLLLCRAFSGSLAACVPLPILTWLHVFRYRSSPAYSWFGVGDILCPRTSSPLFYFFSSGP